MTDYGKHENPIIEAWHKHPECRAEFMQKILIGRYKSLYEWMTDVDSNIKVCGTDPD